MVTPRLYVSVLPASTGSGSSTFVTARSAWATTVVGSLSLLSDGSGSSLSLATETVFVTVPTVLPDSGDVAHHEFQEEIDHLVDCILNDVESHVNLADAVKTHQVCLAIDQSAADGGRPVKLPLA